MLKRKCADIDESTLSEYDKVCFRMTFFLDSWNRTAGRR